MGKIIPKIILILFLAMFLASCTSYDAVRQPDLGNTLDAQRNKVEKDGIEVMVSPIHTKREMDMYFNADLIKKEIMPVQIRVVNKSDRTLTLNEMNIQMTAANGTAMPLASKDQVMKAMKRSYVSTALWTIGLGVFGFIPAIINESNTNEKIESDLEARFLKGGVMPLGAATEGLLFYSVPRELDSINDWTITVPLKDEVNGDDVLLTYLLRGQVEARPKPKQNNNEQESTR